jgi:hypothetical protein
MSNTSEQTGCAARSRKLATISGVVVAVLGMSVFGWGIVISILAGLVVIVGGSIGLTRIMCQDAEEGEPASVIVPPALEQETKVVEEPEVPVVAAPEQSLIKPSTALPGQVELTARKGTWRYQGATG